MTGGVEMIRRDGDWLAAQVGDDLVMMSAREGAFLRFGGVGARIWALLEAPRSRDDLQAALVAEYDVSPDACRRTIDDFLAALLAQRAVRIGSEP